MIVRSIEPGEHERLGRLTVAAYHALPGGITEDDYDAELFDVATRVAAPDTGVLVAVEGDTVLGGVTYVASAASPYYELPPDPDASSFRMLAVDPTRQGSGAGRALVADVVARSRLAGRRRIVIHSTPWMTAAHAMYDRFGFVRRPELDWEPRPGIVLWCFALSSERYGSAPPHGAGGGRRYGAAVRAVVLRSHGGPEVLTIESVPDPVPGPEEVLVDIVASALNRADILQRMGFYPGPPMAHEIPGLEFSGRVAARGARAVLWEPGDAVMGIVGGGGYAERIAVHERQVMAVPAVVGVADGAAVPEVFLTAWDALVVQGGLTSGRWCLVHAGASGVGTAAIQIAKAIGARVAVTCSSGKAAVCRGLGADLVLERSPHDWLGELRSHVPAGVDTVLDVVGGDEVDRNIDALALKGRIIQVGMMSGRTVADVNKLMAKRAGIIGTVLRPRPLEEKIAVTRRFAAEMLPLFDSGALRPVIDSRFPLDAVADAHARMESNANAGKILLDVNA